MEMIIGVIMMVACNPEKTDRLHWDSEFKKTCIPCDYEYKMTPAQKENEHCPPSELSSQRDTQ